MVSSACSKSIKVVDRPWFSVATRRIYLNVPPYTSFTLTICASDPSDWITVAVAAEPEEKARASAPPDSRDARVASSALRFGFPDREYSKPCDMGTEPLAPEFSNERL